MRNIGIKLDEIIEKIGLDPTKLTIINKFIYLSHLISALIKDGHTISLGGPGTGKTTIIKNSSSKSVLASSLTLASFFGDVKKNEDGLISSKSDIVFTEQVTAIKKIDDILLNLILSHCNGDDVGRLGEVFPNRTSIVLLGNCLPDYYISNSKGELRFSKKIDSYFFDVLPEEFKSEQGLERFLLLPSFLLKKITNKLTLGEFDKGFSNYITKNRMDFFKYNLEEMSEREYKAYCKIITAFNFFLNDNKCIDENSDIFKGFKAFASSIVNISIRKKYENFYYKNEEGRKLALVLILDKLPKNSTIEEAHFLENRALIKLKEEDIWYKIALTPIGELENEIEYNAYKKENYSFISEIISISNDNLILKQKYKPLCSNFFKIKDLSYVYPTFDNEIDSLKEELNFQGQVIKHQKLEINELKNYINKLIDSIEDIKKGYMTIPIDKLEVESFNEQINKDLALEKMMNTATNFFKIKKNDFKNRNIGFDGKDAFLINFYEFLN